MKNKRNAVFCILLLTAILFSACSGKDSEQGAAADAAAPVLEAALETASNEETQQQNEAALPDGVYTAEFDTDNSMFRVSEACDGRGTLTVENGEMTIHVSLGSKNIVNLYPGLAEDAKKEGAVLLEPTIDSVTYSDGWTEEVYGFDIPVPVLEEEFDVALIGKKGKWYDHKVIVSNAEPAQDGAVSADKKASADVLLPEEGSCTAEITFEGGSGKAQIFSPVQLFTKDGAVTARVEWNSPNYDYMIVEGEKYLPVNEGGNSVFEIPVAAFDEPLDVIGDTVAMSKPHEIEYRITFHSNTIKEGGERLELSYAENFSVDCYEGGYRLLTIKDGRRILVVPEGKEVPQNLEEDVIVFSLPAQNLYLVASSVMDMFCELDALDAVRLSGQKQDGWYIEAAKKAMEEGDILYAGKYSKPDYELIVSEKCSLAIENMMISHSPEVVEMLNDFGIPVMIDYSSYESHPLGRVEWIKLYGALVGEEQKAQEIFERQEAVLKKVTADEKTNQTVAFFFITSNGLVQVRQSSDYIPKMIELAGGKYIFENLGDPDSSRSTMNMQIEEFYDGAKDADFLIYNSSIDGGVASLEELLEKCPVLEDFKAVQAGNVWCTTNDMYQQSMSIGDLIEDIHEMLLGKGQENMEYLFRLQ